ncbi:MAG: shikimate kinase [Clostridiales bacterium]|nr:shikimate kinase [Clostridiales bacterium]
MKNIALIGLPGCGKTAIGKALSEKLDLEFIDTDALIEAETKLEINKIFKRYGENYFRGLEAKAYKKISKLENRVISTGGGVVLNQENIINLKKNGIIIFISRAPENILLTLDTSVRPLLKSSADKIFTLHKDRGGLYNKYCDYLVDNNGTPEYAINSIYCMAKEGIFNG